jgi:RNA polymerase sigma-B factor
LDAPHTDDDGSAGTLASSFGEEDARFELIDEGLTIATAAKQLPVHERRVLHLRFVQDLTQTQIAERIGVSQMQVSRILRHALGRLEELVKPDALPDELGAGDDAV